MIIVLYTIMVDMAVVDIGGMRIMSCHSFIAKQPSYRLRSDAIGRNGLAVSLR